MTVQRFELHVQVVEAQQHAVDLLAQQSQLSRGQIKKAMNCGAVWLSRGRHAQRLRRATRKLQVDDVLHLYYDSDILNQRPQACQLVADLHHFSVWDKPAGVFSQGTRYGDHCAISRIAEKQLSPQRNAFIVHRLDRDTRGLIIIAHQKAAAAALSRLFQERKIEKKYYARVAATPQWKELPHKISTPLDGKKCVTMIEQIISHADQTATLVVKPETGRKHQIRRHLAQSGFPVIGDKIYGDTLQYSNKLYSNKLYSNKKENIPLQLTAFSLRFKSPFDKKPLEFVLEQNSLQTANKEHEQ